MKERGFGLANARIRGIYSTALTKLFLDHGFDIVQPSITTRERFGLKDCDESPDLDVYDRRDRQGVQAFGRAELINTFCSILQSCLDDVIVRRWAVTADGIYKGLIKDVDPTTQSFLVDVGSAVGRIVDEEVLDPELRQIVVQVERRRVGAKEPVLTTKLKIPGRYAILTPERQVKVSLKIRDSKVRSRLLKLGEELIPPDWGVLWRTAAADQSADVLREEITRLTREGRDVRERAESMEAPATLWEGGSHMNVEFPSLSKKKLDEFRRCVTPTMDGHHYYKAFGRRVSSALDMAEKLLEKGCSLKEVEDRFRQTIEAEFPIVGSVIGMEHVKLDGKVFHLGEALVEAFDRNQLSLRLSRVFEREGVYDGLGTPKEPGDRAVTEAKVGDWHFKTQYFSRDGRYKGTYINFNTPIELYPRGIRYVDLEVDVCVWPNGTVRRLDEEKLKNAVGEGLVTEKLVRIAKEKLREVTTTLC
ncbi:MAG: ribonuclease E/G [Candidatus Bathyarchaeota archaeon]|nr:ribonuclease E/G [Candidatus Bathyarchaeota archaeon]